MKKELEIQSEFFDSLINQNSRLTKIYQELIFYRFDEVLTSAFPLSKSYLENWDSLVSSFIAFGSKESIIWKIPNEFRIYLKNNFNLEPFLIELLWLEWIEIELLMKPNSKIIVAPFDIKNHYKLNAKLKILNYQAYRGFPKEKKKSYLIFYEVNSKIEWIEISKFLYKLFQKSKRVTFSKALKETSKEFKLKHSDTKGLVVEFLEDLYQKAIIS